MINKELLINVGGNDVKVFMEANFFEFSSTYLSAHKHGYTEIHCIESGSFEYTVGNERFIAGPGSLIAIPHNIFHTKRPIGERKFRVCIFQANIKLERVTKYELLPDVFTQLLSIVEEYKTKGNTVKLSSHLALVCSYLIDNAKNRVQSIVDREFLISEYFGDCHLDLTLGALAKILNLSEKQTEREVLGPIEKLLDLLRKHQYPKVLGHL